MDINDHSFFIRKLIGVRVMGMLTFYVVLVGRL